MLPNAIIHIHRFFLCKNIDTISHFIIPKEIANYISITYCNIIQNVVKMTDLMYTIVKDYPEEYKIAFYKDDLGNMFDMINHSLKHSPNIKNHFEQLYEKRTVFGTCKEKYQHLWIFFSTAWTQKNLIDSYETLKKRNDDVCLSFGYWSKSTPTGEYISSVTVSLEEFESFIYDVIKYRIDITNKGGEELYIFTCDNISHFAL